MSQNSHVIELYVDAAYLTTICEKNNEKGYHFPTPEQPQGSSLQFLFQKAIDSLKTFCDYKYLPTYRC